MIKIWILTICFTLFHLSAFAQGKAKLTGWISDELNASIVGASITLIAPDGAERTTTSTADGTYSFDGLRFAKYRVHAVAKGFAKSEEVEIEITTAQHYTLNLTLNVDAIESQVRITADSGLDTDPSANANQILIAGRDLDALPDDADELSAALQALAGAPVGPSGGEILVDGFSGQMPRRDSIAEIRINQNPFGAENDNPSGRIDIVTRPATSQFHGDVSVLFNDESLNSRNPLQITSAQRTPFQAKNLSANLTGPIKKKKIGFLFSFERNETDDNELLRAAVLDSSLRPVQIGQALPVIQRDTSVRGRIDYAVNPRNTVTARYRSYEYRFRNQGVGGFSLPETGYDRTSFYQYFRFGLASTLNAKAISQVEFQYMRNNFTNAPHSSAPALNVSGSFIGGGLSLGDVHRKVDRWELQSLTQLQRGQHAIKFGGRWRGVNVDDVDPTDFNGQWGFAGATRGLTSLERYQRTLQLMRLGLSPAAIRSAGGGAAQFSIAVGNPRARVTQTDLGLYAQDDWRPKPSLTLTYGLRYEIQTNAHSRLGFAPRLSAAWAVRGNKNNQAPGTVIRVGTGVFYNRFNEQSTLTAHRFDGVNVRQFIFSESSDPQLPTDASTLAVLDSFRCADGSSEPNCITALPPLISASSTQQTTWRVAPSLRVPTFYVLGAQVERQLPHHFTITMGGLAVRALHMIRSRDINAPISGTITAALPAGLRPNPAMGEINQIESSGRMSQRQFIVGFNSRLNPQFSISGNYVLSRTLNDTDGQDSSGFPPFPSDSYNLQSEWGSATNDVHHRFSLLGTYSNPKLWKLVFAPLVVASSSPPFNIVTGIDSNLDRQFTERPSFAGSNANCASPFIRCTRYGNFNLAPAIGATIVPRNFGRGTGALTVNLRISRTFGFHAIGQNGKSSEDSRRNTDRKKYNLTISLAFQNLFNAVNLVPPIGNLSSPIFGESQSLAGIGGSGEVGNRNAGNRRINVMLNFSF